MGAAAIADILCPAGISEADTYTGAGQQKIVARLTEISTPEKLLRDTLYFFVFNGSIISAITSDCHYRG
jgi:hypothetical protein